MRFVRANKPFVTVMHTLTPPDGTTKYVNQIVEGAAPSVRIAFFNWRSAFLEKYDVLHIHWPEMLVRDRTSLRSFGQRTALRVLILRSRVLKIPIVRTLHNISPHELGPVSERRALAALDRATSLFIRLNPTTSPPGPAEVVTILHGHYRERFGGMKKPSSQPGRLLYFGLIRPYKGVDTLIEVFNRIPNSEDLSLRLVGKPTAPLREMIENASAGSRRITSRLEFVPDSELVYEIGQSELVCMPYREMHNSGALLVAPSLERPVLVPNSASNAALSLEVGEGWIHMYDGELSPAVVLSTLERIRHTIPSPPRMNGRDWSTVGLAHQQAYLKAISGMRRKTRDN